MLDVFDPKLKTRESSGKATCSVSLLSLNVVSSISHLMLLVSLPRCFEPCAKQMVELRTFAFATSVRQLKTC